jgi:dUTP pyrophosphatase
MVWRNSEDMPPIVKLLWDEDADRNVGLPSYETAGAAGADVRANLPGNMRGDGITLAPLERRIIPTGIRVEISHGFEIQIRPRSGLALKHGITVPNSPGTIDSDYRGPVGVLLVNLGQDPVTIHHADRIAQLIVAPVVQAEFRVVDVLGDTLRGQGGFGSTGRN